MARCAGAPTPPTVGARSSRGISSVATAIEPANRIRGPGLACSVTSQVGVADYNGPVLFEAFSLDNAPRGGLELRSVLCQRLHGFRRQLGATLPKCGSADPAQHTSSVDLCGEGGAIRDRAPALQLREGDAGIASGVSSASVCHYDGRCSGWGLGVVTFIDGPVCPTLGAGRIAPL